MRNYCYIFKYLSIAYTLENSNSFEITALKNYYLEISVISVY